MEETRPHVSSPRAPGGAAAAWPTCAAERHEEPQKRQQKQRRKDLVLPQEKKQEKQKEKQRKHQGPWQQVWRDSWAFAAAAEALIMPIGTSLTPEDAAAAARRRERGGAAAAGVSVGCCSSLLLQTPQILDDAVDALALQHRLSPDDAGFVMPPLKFSYVGTGLQPRLLHPTPGGRALAAAAADSAEEEKKEEEEEEEGGGGGVAKKKSEKGGRKKKGPASAAEEEWREEEEAAGEEESICCSEGQRNRPSYDWLYALGCLNCGKPLTLAADVLTSAEAATAAAFDQPHNSSSSEEAATEDGSSRRQQEDRRPALICSNCGHHVCPLHEANEAESLADAGLLLPDQDGSSSSSSERSSSSSERSSSSREKKAFGVSDGVYLFGLRQQYVTGEWGKRFWQERFLGESFQQQQLQQRLRLVEAVAREKQGVVCKDICERCGNKEAFYSSFQARSADEGMTVMYECTRCGYRRVLNT